MALKLSPQQAMLKAIEVARQGEGWVSPNPLVGAVIVDKEDQFLADGYHPRVGESHAEIIALNKITNPKSLKDAKLYVTLEPCAHQGRTPSCAKTLAQLPLAKVIYGQEDPNPLVQGKGLAILRQAGIQIEKISGLNSELEELTEIFFCNILHQRAFVALKVACSLDSQIALTSGESQWITSEEARQYTHYLRGCYDAILVGSQTVLADNPRLNSRHPNFKNKHTKVIILDRRGRTLDKLTHSQLMSCHKSKDIWIVTEQKNISQDIYDTYNVLQYPTIPLYQTLLRDLYKKGICSIFVEGGAGVYSSLLKERSADRLYQFIAPKLIGGASAISWTRDFDIKHLSEAIPLKNMRSLQLGKDILLTGQLSL